MQSSVGIAKIRWHKASRQLELSFTDGCHYTFPAEFLRVYSPSAEVQNHGNEQQWVFDKEDVTITAIRPVGNYAMQLEFSDGHDTGIYSWQWLLELGQKQTTLTKQYDELKQRHQTEQARQQALIIPIKQQFD